MYTKTIIIETDWLYAIDGRTVKQAIDYLSTLDSEHILSCHFTGDTQGGDIVSSLLHEEPMTDQENYDSAENYFLKTIKYHETSKQINIKNSQFDRAAIHEGLLSEANDNLTKLKARYNIK